MYVEVQLNSIYRNKVWIYDTSFTQPFNLSCVFHRVLRKHKWYCPYVALRLIFSDPYWLILIHTGMSQITPLQGSVNRRATHIFWRDRGGNPKSELWDRSTVQILRKSWRLFTYKVYRKNCLCRHHYWIQIKNMSFLWVVVMLLFEWPSVRIKVHVGNMTSFASDVTLPQPDKVFLGLFRALFLMTEQMVWSQVNFLLKP